MVGAFLLAGLGAPVVLPDDQLGAGTEGEEVGCLAEVHARGGLAVDVHGDGLGGDVLGESSGQR